LLVYEILEVEQFLLTLFKSFGNAVLQWGGDLKFYKGISTCGNANGKHLGEFSLRDVICEKNGAPTNCGKEFRSQICSRKLSGIDLRAKSLPASLLRLRREYLSYLLTFVP
jgi:hypothetical protein